MSFYKVSRAAERSRVDALRTIVAAYKAAGKEIKLVSDYERHNTKCCSGGEDFSYLNDPGAERRG